jgi:hypothetical protein
MRAVSISLNTESQTLSFHAGASIVAPIFEVTHLRHQGVGIDAPDSMYNRFFVIGMLPRQN